MDISGHPNTNIMSEEMGEIKQCKGFDIVLMLGEGEMIGRFVLQRINGAYLKEDVDMTYSNVLGFCPFNKIPTSKSEVDFNNKHSDFAQSLFSQQVWSYRGKHLPEVQKYL